MDAYTATFADKSVIHFGKHSNTKFLKSFYYSGGIAMTGLNRNCLVFCFLFLKTEAVEKNARWRYESININLDGARSLNQKDLSL